LTEGVFLFAKSCENEERWQEIADDFLFYFHDLRPISILFIDQRGVAVLE
jgi:hypothetical protein